MRTVLPSRTTTRTPPPDRLIGEDSLVRVIWSNHRLPILRRSLRSGFPGSLIDTIVFIEVLTLKSPFSVPLTPPGTGQIIDRSDGYGMVAHSSGYSTSPKSLTRLDRSLFPVATRNGFCISETRVGFPEGVSQFVTVHELLHEIQISGLPVPHILYVVAISDFIVYTTCILWMNIDKTDKIRVMCNNRDANLQWMNNY